MRINWAIVTGFLAGVAATWGAKAQAQEHNDGVVVDEIEIACSPVNDFGYVAQVHGTLQLIGLAESGSFTTRGQLRVKAWAYDAGEPSDEQLVTVRGSIAASYLNADVRSDSPLDAMMLAFQSPMSQVGSKDGINYQTDCTQSKVALPQVADLMPLEALRFTDLVDGSQRARISVSNNGVVALPGPSVRVRIAGYDATGTLFQGAGGGNQLESLQQGYIEVDLPSATLARCAEYEVTVDFDQRLQSGPFDPFSNDTRRQTTPCLRWNTTITEETLGATPDPLIIGKTLQAIVSSEVPGRLDSNNDQPVLCSSCHYVGGSTQNYHPPSGPLSPYQNTDGWAWNADQGWEYRFQQRPDKPQHLKQAFLRWRLDGAL